MGEGLSWKSRRTPKWCQLLVVGRDAEMVLLLWVDLSYHEEVQVPALQTSGLLVDSQLPEVAAKKQVDNLKE